VTAVVRVGPLRLVVPVTVANISFKATARIALQPLVEQLPCIGAGPGSLACPPPPASCAAPAPGPAARRARRVLLARPPLCSPAATRAPAPAPAGGVTISLLEAPHVDLSLKLFWGIDLMALPGIKEVVRAAIAVRGSSGRRALGAVPWALCCARRRGGRRAGRRAGRCWASAPGRPPGGAPRRAPPDPRPPLPPAPWPPQHVAGGIVVYPSSLSIPLMEGFGVPPPPKGMLEVLLVGIEQLKVGGGGRGPCRSVVQRSVCAGKGWLGGWLGARGQAAGLRGAPAPPAPSPATPERMLPQPPTHPQPTTTPTGRLHPGQGRPLRHL
jgi:hypothetical protein